MESWPELNEDVTGSGNYVSGLVRRFPITVDIKLFSGGPFEIAIDLVVVASLVVSAFSLCRWWFNHPSYYHHRNWLIRNVARPAIGGSVIGLGLGVAALIFVAINPPTTGEYWIDAKGRLWVEWKSGLTMVFPSRAHFDEYKQGKRFLVMSKMGIGKSTSYAIEEDENA